jgi:hypothetical protein
LRLFLASAYVLQVTEASYLTFVLVRFYKQKKKVQERQENVTEESADQSLTVKNLIKITVLQRVNDIFGIVMFIGVGRHERNIKHHDLHHSDFNGLVRQSYLVRFIDLQIDY